MQDPTFVNLFLEESGNSAASALRTGYVGRLMRCNIYVTSNARSYVDGGAANADVYSMLFLGREAYGTVGIANTTPDVVDRGGDGYSNNTGQSVRPVEIIVKPLGSSGALDPLNQRGSIGWKMSLAIQVLQSSWIRDLEHINAFS
jgi:N4-gp56 family major capsid protein